MYDIKYQEFETKINMLIPACEKEAIKQWYEFAESRVEDEQYIDFTEEPSDIAVGKWLDGIYAGLWLVKQQYGTQIAGQLFNLSTKICLYPDEMGGAAHYLSIGGDISEIAVLTIEGRFEDSSPYYPQIHEFIVEQNILM